MAKDNVMTIGSRVELTDNQVGQYRGFSEGHQFTIYGSSYRGFDLIDDNGEKWDETLFIQDKFKLIE